MAQRRAHPFPATHVWERPVTVPGLEAVGAPIPQPVPFIALPNGDGTLLWGFTQEDLADSEHPTFVKADGQWLVCTEGEDISDQIVEVK